ncbi:MAG: hypothetical protein HYX24_03005 [Candidatus Aenigmarchaeota archaeon]|nr:hypothetical protein [Candidatus Aenigmarchaeota archaeon]
MKEQTIKHLSIFCSLAGLAMLYLSLDFIQPKAASIDSLSISDIGKGVKVCGNITEKSVKNNHIFMKLTNGSGRISIVVFNQTAASIRDKGYNIYNITPYTSLCFLGNVAEYPKGSGALEIIVKRVE